MTVTVPPVNRRATSANVGVGSATAVIAWHSAGAAPA